MARKIILDSDPGHDDAVATAFGDSNGGYAAGMWAGVIILALAFLCSLLIPRPESITDTVAARNLAEESLNA